MGLIENYTVKALNIFGPYLPRVSFRISRYYCIAANKEADLLTIPHVKYLFIPKITVGYNLWKPIDDMLLPVRNSGGRSKNHKFLCSACLEKPSQVSKHGR